MLWDLAEGKRLYNLDAGEIIYALCFSPNRYWLCAATTNVIKVSKRVIKILNTPHPCRTSRHMQWAEQWFSLCCGVCNGSPALEGHATLYAKDDTSEHVVRVSCVGVGVQKLTPRLNSHVWLGADLACLLPSLSSIKS